MTTINSPRVVDRGFTEVKGVDLTIVRRGVTRHRGENHRQSTHHEYQEKYPNVHIHKLRIPQRPLEYYFVRQRAVAGIRNLIAAALCLGIGGFLITHVHSTPKLSVQIILISAVCALLGLYLLPSVIVDLFGKLRVDSNGIRMSPGVFGFNIPWSELSHWNVDGVTFRFRSPKSNHDFATNIQVLSSGDRQELRTLLYDCVGDKERRPAAK